MSIKRKERTQLDDSHQQITHQEKSGYFFTKKVKTHTAITKTDKNGDSFVIREYETERSCKC